MPKDKVDFIVYLKFREANGEPRAEAWFNSQRTFRTIDLAHRAIRNNDFESGATVVSLVKRSIHYDELPIPKFPPPDVQPPLAASIED
jgi:hypothetical protein